MVRVRERRAGDPLAPLTVVVGSAAQRTRVADLLVRGLGGMANGRVVTLSRFARDTVSASLRTPPRSLSRRVNERLVRRLVAAAQPLAYFQAVAGRPHFAQALAATFSDLREALVAPDSAWAARAFADDRDARAADLERLYAAYCAELVHLRLLDDADLYLTAADQVRKVDRSSVILFGVYDLNRAQEALVAALLEDGADAFVPVPCGEVSGREPSVAREQDPASTDGRGAMPSPVVGLAAAAGLDRTAWPSPLDLSDRARLCGLWQSPSTPAVSDVAFRGDGSLAVVSVSDERAEASEAARAVLAAAHEGVAFRDCAVVVPSAGEVERFAAALTAAGVPVAAVRPDRSVGPRIVARLIDCLAPLAGGPLGRREVVDLFSCAALRDPASPRQAALWQDEARRAGVVVGAEQWTSRMPRRVRGLERRLAESESGQTEGGADDDGQAESLQLARDRLRSAQLLSHASATLARHVAAFPQRAAWATWADLLPALVDALFVETDAAAAREVLAGLAVLDVLGEEVMLPEVAAALREQSSDAGVRSGRVGRDGVAIVTPIGLRGLSFDTVVFTGLAEGGFPLRGRPDPILGERERRRLSEALGVRLPLAEAREADSSLLFAFACESARRRLVLIAPRTDAATGRPRLPSRYLLRIASLASGRQVGLEDFLTGRPLGRVWRRGGPQQSDGSPVWVDGRERDVAVLLDLSSGGRREAARQYLAEVLGGEPSARRRLAVWRASRVAEPGEWDGLLGREARAVLAARHPFDGELHPTRLERYVTCPFAFFLQDVLQLDVPDEPAEGLEMAPVDLGSLAHDILQRTYQAVVDDGLDLEAALLALDDAWQAACGEAEQRGMTGAALAWDVTRTSLLDDLRDVLTRDAVFRGGAGRPVAVEWSFGDAAGRPVGVILDDGRSVRFAGRVDRIDADGGQAKVIDYKTGRGRTEDERIKRGLSVQLPVYQLAVRQAGEREFDEVEALYRFVTRRGGLTDLPLPDDGASAAERLVRLVGATLALVDDGVFARSTAGRCDYCDVRYACGTSGWTRGRKRSHEALGALVALQSKGPQEAEHVSG